MAKKCNKCNKEKSLDSFYKDKNGINGRRSVCIECDVKKAKKWNSSNKEAHASHERKHRTNNKDDVKANRARYVKKNPRSVKNSALKFNYGITIDQFEEMSQQQGNACAICEIPKSELTEDLCVDHDHKTSKIRALLCRPCNSALGLMRDNPKVAIKMAEYLQFHRNEDDNG